MLNPDEVVANLDLFFGLSSTAGVGIAKLAAPNSRQSWRRSRTR
jgi:hypothetical protein